MNIELNTVELQSKTIQAEELPDYLLSNIYLRRDIDIFRYTRFIEYITQALLYSVDIQAPTVLLAADGRYYCKEMIERTARVLAGNSVRRILVDSCTSVCAATCLFRDRHCHFGLFFTGGHYPPQECLGFKVISPPGIPMRAPVLEKANKLTCILESYQSCENLSIDFGAEAESEYSVSGRPLTVEMEDSKSLYVEELCRMFDLPFMKEHIKKNKVQIIINCSSGATGPQVRDIFVNYLGVSRKKILNAEPLEDFGGLPTDPNPATCSDFLNLAMANDCDFGAVIGPDGRRCMIIGKDGFVVSPSDLLALIADQSSCIPFFRDNFLKGVVRSICSSQAVKKVIENTSLLSYEVIPGWENFSTAMLPGPGGSIICGEDCSAVGVNAYNYCGDMDSIWTILALLSIMSHKGKSFKSIFEEHWKTFGRHVSSRLDFIDVPQASLDSFMMHLKETYTFRFKKIKSGSFGNFKYLDPFGVDPVLRTAESQKSNAEITFDVENYVHPFGFVRKFLMTSDSHQIYQIHMTKDSRFIIRRSESAEDSTTLRFYLEVSLDSDDYKLCADRKEILQPFINAVLKIAKIEEFFGENITPIIV